MHGAKRILIVWWGTSAGGGPTIGDYMAVSNLVAALQERGAQVDVAAHRDFDFHGAKIVDWRKISPFRYRCVVFVCGPLSNEWYFRLLFYKFWLARKVAVGVSVIDPSQPAVRLFDEIVARDGLSASHFDLSLAGKSTPSRSERSDVLVCLRGRQTEYGADACRSDRVDDLIWKVARRQGLPVKSVNTVVDSASNTIEQIERNFSEAKLVLTTRLHGSLMALRHGVPFIAVDQIEGGRKLTEVVRKLGWEYLYSASVEQPVLDAACARILSGDDIAGPLKDAAAQALRLSTMALQRSVEAILRR